MAYRPKAMNWHCYPAVAFSYCLQAAEPTAAQVAEKLQAQINELLEDVDESLEEVGELDLDELCANSEG